MRINMKKEKKYIEYILKQAEALLAIDSPSGFTEKVTDYLCEEYKRLGYKPVKTKKGGVLVEIGGKSNAVLTMAHVDTLGGMVAEIKSNGRLRLTKVGGLNANNIETENCRIYTLEGKVPVMNAIPFGLLLSLMRMSKLRVRRGNATAYVNVVRGTPLFLQIYIAFFGLPLAGIQIPTFPLGVIVLAMNSSAYLCEIFRAGIQSISKGQFEAARSLGMNGAQTMLFVIIPQTVRRVIPTMTSEFILLYKDTSMLAAVGTMEIVMNAKTIVASTGSITPYVVAACFYLIITLPLAKVVGNLESRLASNDTGKGGKKKRKNKKHAVGTGEAAGALGSGAGTAAAEARATGDAAAAKRPDAVEGTGITPEQMSSL